MSRFEELELKLGDVIAHVSPARGALVTSLSVGGTELLFLNRDTFDDPARNVRGGIPLLFPFAGSLKDNLLAATGTTIRQHGFAREQPWSVIERHPGSIRMAWESNAATEAVFPWRHRLEHSLHLVERGLHVELLIHNLSETPMPISPGWHPYFNCPVEQKELVSGNIPGTEAGNVHDRAEVNYGVVAPAEGRSRHRVPGLGIIQLSFSPEMRHLQIWTMPGQAFICIEPFAGAPDSINNPGTRAILPGEARVLWRRMETEV